MTLETSTPTVLPICTTRQAVPVALPPSLSPNRMFAIRLVGRTWHNGTVLHYHFLAGAGWHWPEVQKQVVREAFQIWKALGIGLEFVETADPSEAEVRIGFDQTEGSWSLVGTDVLGDKGLTRTMNFGWDLTDAWGKATALHEIGHTLGLEHEHQTYKAGIQWNEDLVYSTFSRSPNNWSRQMIYSNILAKVDPQGADASPWDPTSIMEYPFAAQLIKEPPPYNKSGIPGNTELSVVDKAWIRRFYPPLAPAIPIGVMDLHPLASENGAQRDFVFEPAATRDYTVRTIGQADTKLVLFAERGGEPRYVAARDDAGTPDNAEITTRLIKGQRYFVRARTAFVEDGKDHGLVIV